MAPENAPLFVRISLLGISSRTGTVAWIWISVIAAIAVSFYLGSPIGLALLLAALMYWLALRWMDANDGWETPSD